jgi:polyisoprenoid-binding protein YceI
MIKNTIKLLGVLFIGVLVTACSGTSSKTEAGSEENKENTGEIITHNIATDLSTVAWKGTMLGMYSHEGTVPLTEASLTTQGESVVGGKFAVDLSGITPTDANYDEKAGKGPAQLVGHLSSPDFFDVGSFPSASFEVTGSEGSTISGNLTVRGKTNPESVQNVVFDKETGTATGTLTFDRTKYDVSWKHPIQENVISDDIELAIKLQVKG